MSPEQLCNAVLHDFFVRVGLGKGSHVSEVAKGFERSPLSRPLLNSGQGHLLNPSFVCLTTSTPLSFCAFAALLHSLRHSRLIARFSKLPILRSTQNLPSSNNHLPLCFNRLFWCDNNQQVWVFQIVAFHKIV